MGWFAGGEVFRSGVTYRRGAGRIFYFQPGHEEYPTFRNKNVLKIIRNAVHWAKPEPGTHQIECTNPAPLEGLTMFKMDDTVRIKKTGVVGSITDISCAGGSTVYVIDTDTGDDEEGGFGGMYSVFYCTEEELEKV